MIADGAFLGYAVLLGISGIILLVIGIGGFGQSTGARVFDVLFGTGFFGYSIYLIFFFPGGHFRIFFYAFVVPVLAVVNAVKSAKAKREAAGQAGTGFAGAPGMAPYPQAGYVPGQQGFGPAQPGFVPGQPGVVPAQQGSGSGRQDFGAGQFGAAPQGFGVQQAFPGQPPQGGFPGQPPQPGVGFAGQSPQQGAAYPGQPTSPAPRPSFVDEPTQQGFGGQPPRNGWSG